MGFVFSIGFAVVWSENSLRTPVKVTSLSMSMKS